MKNRSPAPGIFPPAQHQASRQRGNEEVAGIHRRGHHAQHKGRGGTTRNRRWPVPHLLTSVNSIVARRGPVGSPEVERIAGRVPVQVAPPLSPDRVRLRELFGCWIIPPISHVEKPRLNLDRPLPTIQPHPCLRTTTTACSFATSSVVARNATVEQHGCPASSHRVDRAVGVRVNTCVALSRRLIARGESIRSPFAYATVPKYTPFASACPYHPGPGNPTGPRWYPPVPTLLPITVRRPIS